MQFSGSSGYITSTSALSQTFQQHDYVDQAPIVDVNEVIVAAKYQLTEARCEKKILFRKMQKQC